MSQERRYDKGRVASVSCEDSTCGRQGLEAETLKRYLESKRKGENINPVSVFEPRARRPVCMDTMDWEAEERIGRIGERGFNLYNAEMIIAGIISLPIWAAERLVKLYKSFVRKD